MYGIFRNSYYQAISYLRITNWYNNRKMNCVSPSYILRQHTDGPILIMAKIQCVYITVLPTKMPFLPYSWLLLTGRRPAVESFAQKTAGEMAKIA